MGEGNSLHSFKEGGGRVYSSTVCTYWLVTHHRMKPINMHKANARKERLMMALGITLHGQITGAIIYEGSRLFAGVVHTGCPDRAPVMVSILLTKLLYNCIRYV